MKLTKKILAVVLSVLFVVGVFAGCSSKDANTKDTTTKASASSDMKVEKNIILFQILACADHLF